MVRKTHDESLQDEKKPIVYRYVEADCISKTQDLADIIFGRHYTKVKLCNENQFTITAFYNDELVGFGIGLIAKTGKYNNLQLAQLPIGILQLVGVIPEYRNLGIGVGLMIRIVEKLAPLQVFGFAWEKEGVIMADSRLTSIGLKKVKEMGHIWKDACDKRVFHCPNRIDVCNCTAVLYSKK
jgi:hypothetical protein